LSLTVKGRAEGTGYHFTPIFPNRLLEAADIAQPISISFFSLAVQL